jgi:manganese-dependent inorganic pyrophosphatase
MATRALPLMRKDLTILRGDYPLSKVSSKAKAFFGRTIYVCDENEKLQGLFSNTDLINLPKQKLVLVDHNELSQAVRGAEEADIIEIIDHHRLGSASTQSPILFLNKPVGSTCTIISSMFRRSGLKIDKQTAGLLCSGIVCDTLNLKSPTATSEDAEEIDALSKIIGISGAQLADYVFSGDSVILSNSADDVVLADCKIYNEGDVDFSVSQIEELDFSNFNSKLEELRTALERYRKAHNLYFSALFITNVLTQDSLLMICGADEFASRINYAKDSEREVFELPKIVSRKKQLIPYLSALLKD